MAQLEGDHPKSIKIRHGFTKENGGMMWDDVGCSGWIMGNSMDKFIGPNPARSAELMGRIGVTIPK